jgi:hydrogenase maturation protein HypF
MAPRRRIAVRVEGIVQGVGFRPFVYALAAELGLDGFVGNDEHGVFVEVEGDPEVVTRFDRRLRREAPALALIERVTVHQRPPLDRTGFAIVASPTGRQRRTLVSPDVATCDACLADIADPTDRRHRYAFTNCTDCGPRFTIVRDVPYDRARTTMAAFVMCPECRREYEDPTDRRFHAQPVCCPACGPRLALRDRDGEVTVTDPLLTAASSLREGHIVAVKGLGGYHFAVDARHGAAVDELRRRKHREEKPFAVLVADVADADRWCEVDDTAAQLLRDRARPIVLLPRRAVAGLADAVAPGNRSLGLMLPYTPLHHLLLDATGGPVVLTSGNVSDEPIAYDDADATERLAPIADLWLTHDRVIHVRTDDSVARAASSGVTLLRRSRGFAPAPIGLSPPLGRPVLAVGAELKNTICVARGSRAFVSQHLGDLENYETFTAFLTAIEHLCRLFDIVPELVAHDLHPEYRSTKHAFELDTPHLGVQHHHAHIASCLADNAEVGPVIGVAFDGTGYGTDGTLWGGEVLVADLATFERVGYLRPLPLPGGAAAIRAPWRMAAAHLRAAFGEDLPSGLAVHGRNEARWDAVLALAAAGINSPPTSSAGRLFDAVAALLDVRDTITYEGQAAIELEQLAHPGPARAYPFPVADGPPFVLEPAPLIRAIVEDLAVGTVRSEVAARFHASVAAGVVASCVRVRDHTGLTTVALSGGVFQNLLLTEQLVAGLRQEAFRVLTHRRVPPNDGGISLGQAVVAGATCSELPE